MLAHLDEIPKPEDDTAERKIGEYGEGQLVVGAREDLGGEGSHRSCC